MLRSVKSGMGELWAKALVEPARFSAHKSTPARRIATLNICVSNRAIRTSTRPLFICRKDFNCLIGRATRLI